MNNVYNACTRWLQSASGDVDAPLDVFVEIAMHLLILFKYLVCFKFNAFVRGIRHH